MMSAETLPQAGHNSGQVPLAEVLASAYEPLATEVSTLLDEARALPDEVESDEHVAAYTEVAKRIRSLASRADQHRTSEKEPHLKAGRDVDAFFKAFVDRLTKAKDVLERRASTYLTKKAEEERLRRAEAEKAAREEASRLLRQAEEAEKAKKALVADLALDAASEAERRATGFAQAATASAHDLARTKSSAGTAGLKTEWTFTIDDLSAVDLNALRPFFSRAAVEQALGAAVRNGLRQATGVTIFETQKATFR